MPKHSSSRLLPRHLSEVAPFDGLDRRLAAATMIDRLEGKPTMFGASVMLSPTVSLARFDRIGGG
ncbi:MAG TPA: hypothetical protein VH326_13815 [Sphingomonas sp.]|jgi:hypothetical protein|nr:hypothetical protein [Sphingomonas sp.]